MFKKQSKLTVAIALYKPNYLNSLFKNLKLQTFRDVEYIISNDNPTNIKTKEFLAKMKEEFKNVKIFNHYEPLGAYKNYDFCFDKSNGEYFIRLDDDDYFKHSNHLEKMVNELDNGYDFVFANVDIKIIKKNQDIELRENVMDVYGECESRFDFAKSSIEETAMVFYSMFRKVELSKYYRYVCAKKNRYHFFEGLFVHKVLSELKGKFVNNQNLIYRVSSDSISMSSNKNFYFNNHFIYSINSINYFLFKSPFLKHERLLLALKLFLKVMPTSFYYLAYNLKSRLLRYKTFNAIKNYL